MSNDEMTRESVRDFLRGYARADPGGVARLAEVDDWQRIAREELERRVTGIVRMLDDATLEAVATGDLDMRAVCLQALRECAEAGYSGPCSNMSAHSGDGSSPGLLQAVASCAMRPQASSDAPR